MITMTVAQIADLAKFAGLSVSDDDLVAAGPDNEFTVADCPADGVYADDGTPRQYDLVVYCTDYPEEGMIGLGPEVSPNAA